MNHDQLIRFISNTMPLVSMTPKERTNDELDKIQIFPSRCPKCQSGICEEKYTITKHNGVFEVTLLRCRSLRYENCNWTEKIETKVGECPDSLKINPPKKPRLGRPRKRPIEVLPLCKGCERPFRKSRRNQLYHSPNCRKIALKNRKNQ